MNRNGVWSALAYRLMAALRPIAAPIGIAFVPQGAPRDAPRFDASYPAPNESGGRAAVSAGCVFLDEGDRARLCDERGRPKAHGSLRLATLRGQISPRLSNSRRSRQELGKRVREGPNGRSGVPDGKNRPHSPGAINLPLSELKRRLD